MARPRKGDRGGSHKGQRNEEEEEEEEEERSNRTSDWEEGEVEEKVETE